LLSIFLEEKKIGPLDKYNNLVSGFFEVSGLLPALLPYFDSNLVFITQAKARY
jgi:hypothetical protein